MEMQTDIFSFFLFWSFLLCILALLVVWPFFLVPITELDTISSLLYFHDICNLRFCPFLVCYSRFEGDEVGMPKHGIDGECKDIKCFFKECSPSSKFHGMKLDL